MINGMDIVILHQSMNFQEYLCRKDHIFCNQDQVEATKSKQYEQGQITLKKYLYLKKITKKKYKIYRLYKTSKNIKNLNIKKPKYMQPRITQLHNTNPKCLKQYGYFQDKNFPIRKTMQDNYFALDEFIDKGSGLFCILDGHGGGQVSQYCSSALPNIFQQQYSKTKNDIKGVFQRTFVKADDQLKLVGATQTGTTCCLVFVKNNGNNKLVHVANLGDTRAVLSVDGVAKRVSTDHKTTNTSQQERIKKQGGLILKGRVAGQLAITRALGDLMLKTEGVSNIPDIQTFPVDASAQFLIIASDGLWDVCQDQQAVDMIKNMTNTKDMAKTLVQFALKNGTQDNVSVLVLRFK